MKKAKRYLSMAGIAVASLLVTLALTASLSIDSYHVLDPVVDALSFWPRSLTYCYRSFSSDRLLTMAVMLFAVILLIRVKKQSWTKKEKVLALIFAALFSMMQLVGRSYSANNSWDAIIGRNFVMFRALIVFLGVLILVYAVMLLLFRAVDHIAEQEGNGLSSKSWGKKHWLSIAGILFLCWLPYYVLLFPGTGNADTSMQIMQFFHEPTSILRLSAVRDDSITITNHHPVFTTFLFGTFAKLGIVLGDIKWGIAIYAVLQMLLTALVFSGMLMYLHRIGLSSKWVKYGTVFLGLFPLFPLHTICMLKDSLFSLACLVLTILSYEIVRTKGDALRSKRFLAGLFFAELFVALTKNQGVYIVLGTAIVCFLIYFRKYWKQILAAMLLTVFLFQVVWIDILLPMWNIAPGGKQEALGLLFQQTARYVKTYPDEVTQEEKDAIRAVLDYDNLAELYDPILADDVKYTFNQDATQAELNRYFKAWFQMFLKHPNVYIQATLNNCYAFFYISRISSLAYTEFVNRAPEDSDAYVDSPWQHSHQELVRGILQMIQRIPVLSLISTLSFYVWNVLFCFLNCIRRKQYKTLAPLIVAILSVGVLIMSPDNGNLRYSMPLLYISFFIFAVSCIIKSEAANKEINNSQILG